MTKTTYDKAKEIRRMFRSRMDGTVAQNMREKGMEYHVNWGVTISHLQELAAEYGKDLHVALELWKDNVRESKIMALMIMPVEECTPDIAHVWIDTMGTQEIAEMASMLLFQHLPYAPAMAYGLLAQGGDLKQILGYNILSRLIARGEIPDARGLDELIDQIKISMKTDNVAVRHAAYNCFMKLNGCDKLAESPFWHALCQGLE